MKTYSDLEARALERLADTVRREASAGKRGVYCPRCNGMIEAAQPHAVAYGAASPEVRHALMLLDVARAEAVSSCGATKSDDGGSCGNRAPCDGKLYRDGTQTGGCGEPCEWIMRLSGAVFS